MEEARQVEAHECASLGLRIGYPLYDAFHESLLVLLLLLLEKAFLWVQLQLPDHRRLSSPNLWIGSARQSSYKKFPLRRKDASMGALLEKTMENLRKRSFYETSKQLQIFLYKLALTSLRPYVLSPYA